MLRDPLGEAVYWQSLVINPGKQHQEEFCRSIFPTMCVCVYSPPLHSIFQTNTCTRARVMIHTCASEHSARGEERNAALQRAEELRLTPGYRGAPVICEKMHLVIHDSSRTQTYTEQKKKKGKRKIKTRRLQEEGMEMEKSTDMARFTCVMRTVRVIQRQGDKAGRVGVSKVYVVITLEDKMRLRLDF